MVRRLPLTALLAVLAVAMPAAAEETSSEPPEPAPEAEECPPLDPFCVPAAEAAWETTWSVYDETLYAFGMDSDTCRALDLNSEQTYQAIDPDGCLRAFVKRAIGVSVYVTLGATDPAQQTIDPAWPF